MKQTRDKWKVIYYVFLIYSLAECAVLWFGMRSPVPALVIVVSVLLALLKALYVIADMMFYKKQGYYHGYHSASPEFMFNRWPLFLFLGLDIAAIVFCKRNTIVFLVIAAVYTLLSLGIQIYTHTEYERIKRIMDGNGEHPVRIR